MQTIYDWVTIGLFAVLIVIFLQRSTQDRYESDRLWHYLVASAGCGVANYLGNHGYKIAAVSVLAAVITFIVMILKPFGPKPHL